MACSYYKFRQNDYFCYKKDGYVNYDVYERYCKNYDYKDCPIYKKEENNSCFITSACIGILGCTDDSEELNILRNFRDTYMCKNCDLQSEIQEYYDIAPQIVQRINTQKNFYDIYKNIYYKMIAPCINAIKNSRFDEAYNIYKQEYLKLKEKFYKQ